MKIVIPTIGSRGDVQPFIALAQGLAAALGELARDGEMRAAAAALGEQIRAENGVAEAVRVIEEVMT